MRPTLKDAAVIYVDGDGKFHNGVIHEAFGPTGAARIDLTPRKRDEKGNWIPADPEKPIGHTTLQATYSDKGEKNTFHYADEKDAVAKTIAERKQKPEPAAPAPATEPKKKE